MIAPMTVDQLICALQSLPEQVRAKPITARHPGRWLNFDVVSVCEDEAEDKPTGEALLVLR
jgi:hypothetical protein